MSTDYERQLLARARELADLGELAEAVTGMLGGGPPRRARPGRARRPGRRRRRARRRRDRGVRRRERPRRPVRGREGVPRRPGRRRGRDRRAAQGRRTAPRPGGHRAGLRAGALDAARAMRTSEPCDGCHGREGRRDRRRRGARPAVRGRYRDPRAARPPGSVTPWPASALSRATSARRTSRVYSLIRRGGACRTKGAGSKAKERARDRTPIPPRGTDGPGADPASAGPSGPRRGL